MMTKQNRSSVWNLWLLFMSKPTVVARLHSGSPPEPLAVLSGVFFNRLRQKFRLTELCYSPDSFQFFWFMLRPVWLGRIRRSNWTDSSSGVGHVFTLGHEASERWWKRCTASRLGSCLLGLSTHTWNWFWSLRWGAQCCRYTEIIPDCISAYLHHVVLRGHFTKTDPSIMGRPGSVIEQAGLLSIWEWILCPWWPRAMCL